MWPHNLVLIHYIESLQIKDVDLYGNNWWEGIYKRNWDWIGKKLMKETRNRMGMERTEDSIYGKNRGWNGEWFGKELGRNCDVNRFEFIKETVNGIAKKLRRNLW